MNAPDDYATLRIEPGSDVDIVNYRDEVMKYSNGAELFMDCVYLYKGEYWGCMQVNTHRYYPPAWIPMDYLLAVYIPTDFNKENGKLLYTYTGNLDTVFAAERLVLWQWPGSDREKRVFDNKNIKDISAIHAYKDKNGQEWGYVKIEYSYANSSYTSTTYSWIYIAEPDNSNIAPFYPAPEPTKWSPDGVFKWTHLDTPANTSGQYTLSNITKVKKYESKEYFTDIVETAWYKNAIITAYEYGIINGKGNNTFDPGGNLKIGEALTIASLIHAYYKYRQEEGSRWINVYNYAYNYTGHAGSVYRWDGALEYCSVEGLIHGNEFYDYIYSKYWDSYYGFRYDDEYYFDYLDFPITRAQIVHAWVKILQPKDMVKQNTVITIPDVNADMPYFNDIILFYEAGIIGGVDALGTFNPDSNITRAEAATIFMNLIDVSKRHSDNAYGS